MIRLVPTVFIDMDGVIADFDGACASQGLDPKVASNKAHFYRDLPLMPGAVENVRRLYDEFNLYIASSPKWTNPYSFTEKLHWLERNFPYLHADRRVLIIPNKSMLRGDFIIDDHPEWNGTHNFVGKVITFRGDWDYVWQQLKTPCDDTAQNPLGKQDCLTEKKP